VARNEYKTYLPSLRAAIECLIWAFPRCSLPDAHCARARQIARTESGFTHSSCRGRQGFKQLLQSLTRAFVSI